MNDVTLETVHAVLAELQRAVAAKDRTATLEKMTGDIVLFGTAAANFGPAETEAYLQLLFALDGVVRWNWERVQIVDARPGAITFVALGSVGFDDDDHAGEDRQPIRLSALIVDEGYGWQLRHFHGSTPEAP